MPKIKDVDHFYYSQSEISNPQWIHFTSRPNDLPAPFPVFSPFTFDLCPMPYAFQFRIPTSKFRLPHSHFRIQMTILSLAWLGPKALIWATRSRMISANWMPSLAPIQVNLSRS